MIKRLLLATAALVTFTAYATDTDNSLPEPDGTYLYASRDTVRVK